jgi:hypothetical protein
MRSAARFLLAVGCAWLLLASCDPGNSDGGGDLLSDVPRTGQVLTFADGDDGDLQAGIEWPSPRFTASGGCVTDALTGLMWVAAPDATTRTWAGALSSADTLSFNGYEDWRLPNINELQSLVNPAADNASSWLNGQGFTGVQSSRYWTSTPYFGDASQALIVYMYDGSIGSNAKTFGGNYSLAVRGLTMAPAPLPRTGWTTMSLTGDDGDLEAGAAWPVPRFTDNADGTLTDKLTGLTWTADGNAPGPAACDPGVAKTWQEALDYVACLNANTYLGHADWRLPNRNEMRSLVHYGETSAGWLNTQGFSSAQGLFYWTSTTYAYNSETAKAWCVDLGTATVDYSDKASTQRVWAVRVNQ